MVFSADIRGPIFKFEMNINYFYECCEHLDGVDGIEFEFYNDDEKKAFELHIEENAKEYVEQVTFNPTVKKEWAEYDCIWSFLADVARKYCEEHEGVKLFNISEGYRTE